MKVIFLICTFCARCLSVAVASIHIADCVPPCGGRYRPAAGESLLLSSMVFADGGSFSFSWAFLCNLCLSYHDFFCELVLV